MENLEVNGFVEVRAGCRTQNDPHEKDLSVMDTRLRMEVFTYNDLGDFKYKADLWGDGITEQGEYDTREAWFFLRPSDSVDLKTGRQVLTWGTGDLVFLNDLFPKDWQSFFIGRDDEYLKAPSDAVKLSFFTDLASVDLVYTPQFDPDRFITGEYISHWNGRKQRLSGQDAPVDADRPDKWFRDDEIAIRIYKNINNYEYALYGYSGFWKRPAGESPEGGKTLFPRLNVYGASVRGQLGSGIGNLELAWYDSRDDTGGANAMAANSEMRYLMGYTRDMAKDFNVSLQYYVEQMLNYKEYKKSLTKGPARDRARHVITLQLTKLMMNQNLSLALSAYLSPSDEDACLRPKIGYKASDRLVLEAGANIFTGKDTHTFFAQFENNTNVYTAIRYSF
ncbi:MAG: hypothetical protein GY737_25345 [Desulfobacteraceae bacterium]|nr:hypothetical protein [Desulfobacteraceae bacterium]